jgi:hypothetical protein
VGHLVQFTLKPGGLLCSSGGSGVGGGGGGGGGGGHLSELLFEPGDGGGSSFGFVSLRQSGFVFKCDNYAVMAWRSGSKSNRPAVMRKNML